MAAVDDNFRSQFQKPEIPGDELGEESTKDIRSGLKGIGTSLKNIVQNTAVMPILNSNFKEQLKGMIGLGFLGPMYGALGEIAEFGPIREGLGKLYETGARTLTWMKKELYTLLWFSFRGLRAALAKVSGSIGSMWKWLVGGGFAAGLLKFLKLGLLPLLGGILVGKDAYAGYKEAGIAGAVGYGLGGIGGIGTRLLTGTAKGALIGAIFGPVGSLIGAGIGVLLGAIGGERITKEILRSARTIKQAYDWASKNVFIPVGKAFAMDWHRWGGWISEGYEWFKGSIWDPIVNFTKKLWNDPGGMLLKGYKWFKDSVWTPVTGFLGDMWNDPGGMLLKGYTWFKDTIWSPVTGFFSDMWKSPGTTLKNSYEWYKNTIHDPFTKFMGKMFDWVGQFIPGYGKFKEVWTKYEKWLGSMFDSVGVNLKSKYTWFKNVVWNPITDFLNGMWTSLGDSISDTKEWIETHMSLDSWIDPIKFNLVKIKDYIVGWPVKLYEDFRARMTSVFSKDTSPSRKDIENANELFKANIPTKKEEPVLSKSEETKYWQSEINAMKELTNSVNKLVKIQESQTGQQTTESRKALTFRELKKALDEIPVVLNDSNMMLINSGVR
jgi:hypothetical protein